MLNKMDILETIFAYLKYDTNVLVQRCEDNLYVLYINNNISNKSNETITD